MEEEADDAEVSFVVVEIELRIDGNMRRENFREFLVLVAAWATGMQWSGTEKARKKKLRSKKAERRNREIVIGYYRLTGSVCRRLD